MLASLTDEQIAAVVNYVRTHFGNDFKDPTTAKEVAELPPGEGFRPGGITGCSSAVTPGSAERSNRMRAGRPGRNGA
jgi:hypothetical protein